jgi:hypothetical protein
MNPLKLNTHHVVICVCTNKFESWNCFIPIPGGRFRCSVDTADANLSIMMSHMDRSPRLQSKVNSNESTEDTTVG